MIFDIWQFVKRMVLFGSPVKCGLYYIGYPRKHDMLDNIPYKGLGLKA